MDFSESIREAISLLGEDEIEAWIHVAKENWERLSLHERMTHMNFLLGLRLLQEIREIKEEVIHDGEDHET